MCQLLQRVLPSHAAPDMKEVLARLVSLVGRRLLSPMPPEADPLAPLTGNDYLLY